MVAYLVKRAGTIWLPAAVLFLASISPALDGRAEIIGQWTFNEGMGTNAFDSTTNANHGVISNGTAFVASPGSFAISLNGINQAVNYGPDIFNYTNEAFSVEVWVAIDATQSGRNHGIFGKGGGSSAPGSMDGSWLLGYEHTDSNTNVNARLNVHICTPAGCGGGGETIGPAAMPFGEYKHVVFTKSTASPLTIYVDGVLERQSGGFAELFAQPTVDLRAGAGSGNFLECQIDEIRVHDLYLSGQQVADSFDEGPTVAPIPPEMLTAVRADTMGTEFLSEAGQLYELEISTNTVDWAGTGATVIGTGTNIFLFDPTGFDTGKTYRVSIKL